MRVTKRFITFLILCVAFRLNTAVPTAPVPVGKKTTRWGHHVALCDPQSGSFFCGGSIITDVWIVTAAHCIFRGKYANFRIKAGVLTLSYRRDSCSKNVSPDEELHDVQRVVVHPHAGDPHPYSNDIAMIKLKTRLNLTNNTARVRRIVLQHRTPPIMPDRTCYAIGWGNADRWGKNKVLMEVALLIKSHLECLAVYDVTRLDTSMFCAGENGTVANTCSGDSGGGLTCNVGGYWILAGITSWGILGCETTGVYSNMDRLLGFVDEVFHPKYRIRHLALAMGSNDEDTACPPGYVRVPQNLHNGIAFTYLCVDRAPNVVNGITALDVVTSRTARCPSGFRRLGSNVNHGRFGESDDDSAIVIICYERLEGKRQLVDIVAYPIFKDHRDEPPPAGYIIIATPVVSKLSWDIYLAYKLGPYLDSGSDDMQANELVSGPMLSLTQIINEENLVWHTTERDPVTTTST